MGDCMKNKIKILLFNIVSIFIIIEVIYNLFLKINLVSNNEEFIKILLNNKNYYELYLKDYNTTLNKSIRFLTNIEIKNPISILEKNFKYKEKSESVIYTTSSDNDYSNDNSKYIKDPVDKNVSNPSVYIYSTHQLESYNKKALEDYNITPNVMMASYLLRDNLSKYNINTVVETGNITDFLNTNGWDYKYSYKASRYYLKKALNKYKNLKLIIDLHRDSVKKNYSTITINNKKYAKVLFVIGLEHKNYKDNLLVANKLNDILNKKYPKLSRGIMKKEGKNVNGIYNQDLNKNIILIELGGNENNLEEVMNTSIALSDVINEYLEG